MTNRAHSVMSRAIAVVVLMLYATCGVAATLTGRVVSVHDGDTITVLDGSRIQHKIRLAGIDAPELGQAFGKTSRNHLAERVAGQTVTVEWHKLDRYQRVIGKVLLQGEDLCLAQVTAGMAWHYVKYAKEQVPDDRVHYATAEQAARGVRRGLWNEAGAIPPWEWRTAKR